MAISVKEIEDARIYFQWENHNFRDVNALFSFIEKEEGRPADVFLPEIQPPSVGSDFMTPRLTDLELQLGEEAVDYLRSNNVRTYFIDVPAIPANLRVDSYETPRAWIGRGISLTGLALATYPFYNWINHKAHNSQVPAGELEEKASSRRKFLKSVGCAVLLMTAGQVVYPDTTVPSSFPGKEGPIRKELREFSQVAHGLFPTWKGEGRSAVKADRIEFLSTRERDYLLAQGEDRKVIIASLDGVRHGQIETYLDTPSARRSVLTRYQNVMDSLPPRFTDHVTRINWNNLETPEEIVPLYNTSLTYGRKD